MNMDDFYKMMKKFGLSKNQANILYLCQENKDYLVSKDIQEALGLYQARVNEALNYLDSEELIFRNRKIQQGKGRAYMGFKAKLTWDGLKAWVLEKLDEEQAALDLRGREAEGLFEEVIKPFE